MKTVFSNGRKTFDTLLEGETLVMKGQATIGAANGNNCQGQIYAKEGDSYVGDYSKTYLSLSDPSRADSFVEAAGMLVQLASDMAEKEKEEEELP